MSAKFQVDLFAKTAAAPGRTQRVRWSRPARNDDRRSGRRGLYLRFASLLIVLVNIAEVTAYTPFPASRNAAFATRSVTSDGMVAAVDAIGVTVSDADRALAFFTKVLSFEVVSDVEVAGTQYERLQGVFGLRMRIVRLRLGDEFLELTEYLAPKGRPIPVDSRSNDRWFQHIAIITTDMDRAYAWLRQNKVQHASTGPQKLPETIKAAAGIRAFYFKDPDGHVLEVLQFPPDKGASKWHAPSDKLFLGIDHTAIVVADTDNSLRFYRDELGMKISGASENFGTEQEHLNNVFGARLRITALRAASGPGIEFLEYLAPRDGRPAPADQKANDLIHWQTKLVTMDSGEIARRLNSNGSSFVSSGLIEIPGSSLGFRKGFLVRDPDGHVMQVIEGLSK